MGGHVSVCGTLFRCTGLLVHTRRVCATPCPGISFFLHRAIGAPEPRRRFTLSGRQFFQHRLSGVRELRQRVRPDGRLLSLHRLTGATRTALAGSPLTGGEFFAKPQRGDSPSADGGTSRRPPRGQKGRTTYGFPSSLNSYLSLCFLIWRRLPTCDRYERGGRQRIFFFRVFLNLFAVSDTVLLHIWATLRWVRHNSAAQFDSAL